MLTPSGERPSEKSKMYFSCDGADSFIRAPVKLKM